MNARQRISTYLLAGILLLVPAFGGLARQTSEASKEFRQPTERDGQHDFDFEIGTWKVTS
jgi:hypothetical protein